MKIFLTMVLVAIVAFVVGLELSPPKFASIEAAEQECKELGGEFSLNATYYTDNVDKEAWGWKTKFLVKCDINTPTKELFSYEIK